MARFHLGNGARLERLNWLADGSDNGIAQSYGLMVNYLYDLDDIEKNHEAYAEGRRVVASSAVRRLLRGARRPNSCRCRAGIIGLPFAGGFIRRSLRPHEADAIDARW